MPITGPGRSSSASCISRHRRHMQMAAIGRQRENLIEFVALLSLRSTVTGYETQIHRGQPWAYFAVSEDYILGSKDICTLTLFAGENIHFTARLLFIHSNAGIPTHGSRHPRRRVRAEQEYQGQGYRHWPCLLSGRYLAGRCCDPRVSVSCLGWGLD